MEPSPEKSQSKITFKNQPKLSGFEVDQKRDERRVALVPEIEHFLSTDEMFVGKDVTVEFSHSGVSSLLCFIEAEDEKYVLKIPLTNAAPKGSEALFLKAWENGGVKVPHIFKEGEIGGRGFVLMEYVDAPLLTDAMKQKLVKDDVSIEAGRILAEMHSTTAEGFGRVKDGKPEFNNFKEWLQSEDMQVRIKNVQENNLLTDEHGSISKVMSILTEYSVEHPGSTYCHFDFGSDNILATKPLTVIDPDPMLNLGIIDLGRSILLARSGKADGKQLKDGYLSKINVNEKVLHAAVILNAYMKFPYWHKKKKTKQMENVRQYLEENEDLL